MVYDQLTNWLFGSSVVALDCTKPQEVRRELKHIFVAVKLWYNYRVGQWSHWAKEYLYRSTYIGKETSWNVLKAESRVIFTLHFFDWAVTGRSEAGHKGNSSAHAIWVQGPSDPGTFCTSNQSNFCFVHHWVTSIGMNGPSPQCCIQFSLQIVALHALKWHHHFHKPRRVH